MTKSKRAGGYIELLVNGTKVLKRGTWVTILNWCCHRDITYGQIFFSCARVPSQLPFKISLYHQFLFWTFLISISALLSETDFTNHQTSSIYCETAKHEVLKPGSVVNFLPTRLISFLKLPLIVCKDSKSGPECCTVLIFCLVTSPIRSPLLRSLLASFMRRSHNNICLLNWGWMLHGGPLVTWINQNSQFRGADSWWNIPPWEMIQFPGTRLKWTPSSWMCLWVAQWRIRRWFGPSRIQSEIYLPHEGEGAYRKEEALSKLKLEVKYLKICEIFSHLKLVLDFHAFLPTFNMDYE